MKIKLPVLLCLLISSLGFGQVSDLIISEYCEGTGNNKYIEIYNGTGTSINLSNYEVWLISNGGTWPETTLNLSGTLLNGDTYVIASNLTSPAPDGAILAAADLISPVVNFNGDDAIGLAKDISGTMTLIDAIGTSGADPGTGWNVAGETNATANRTLVRKSTICTPNINWNISAGTTAINSEWIVFGTDNFTDVGIHFESCSTLNTIVEFTNITSSISENGNFIDICINISNPSTTAATTVDITLDAASTATNGADYDDGAGTPAAIVFPQTLTFPANSSADECLTIFISNDDLLIEGNETVVLNLTNPAGGDSAALGVNTQHVLTIMDNDAPFPANVVITEIMYNSAGIDDEWIEICNVSGITQVLNNYRIDYNGSPIFTFPSTGVLIPNGTCITVSLGSNGDGTYNNLCPFTPDYGIDAFTNDTNNLDNTSANIRLVASDGTTTIDTVTYDDGDGADNTGESLHIVDTALDNSVTNTNWWEVLNGGSPGVNSLISPCTPVGPEINVEGTTANFPDIADGDVTPAAFDGTDFGNVPVFGTSTNTFRIENFGGTQNLNIAGVTVVSGDIGDFSISSLPSTPISPANPNGFSNFDVEFSPTTIGPKTAVIQIISNDTDENPYTFTVAGNAECVANAISATPNSGPINTIVTVTGTNLSTATASFNGLAATVNNISATVMEVTVPTGAISGNLEIIDDLGCPGAVPFTIINSQISSCEGSSGTIPTDLFISEVTDANTGGLTYIEIYNGTGVTINLDSYNIQFFNNGSATHNGGIVDLNNVNLASGNTYVVGVSSGSNCTGITGADGSLANQTGFGGVNFVVNGDDHIRLYDGSTHIDSWGTYSSNTWADTLGIGSEGAVFTRNSNAGSLPNTIFNLADWSYVDWASCNDNDYSNIGIYDFSTGTPPTVSAITTSTTNCNEATISVTASQGFPSGNPLQYVFYFYNPAQAGLGWQQINNGGIYTTNANSPDLIISDAASVTDYQFYCQVREDSATCFTASNAIQITLSTVTWDGTNWNWNDGTAQNTLPTISANVIINGNYNTGLGGLQTSFSACNLSILNGTVNIANGDYIEVFNDVQIESTPLIPRLRVQPQGAFVQVNNDGTVTGNARISKLTAPMNAWYEYTYWSTPVNNAIVETVLSQSNANRRFWFNAQNYLDTVRENNNDGIFVAGQDDVDDNANDWTLAAGTDVMVPGRGYAATLSQIAFVFGPGSQYQFDFDGVMNNGIINVPIYRNDNETADNNWNFIGNPYPSAINANTFLTENATVLNENAGALSGAIYLWSQNTVPSGTANGNENLNFAQADYAVINGSGNAAGGDGVTPSNFIPSGQGFFVAMDNTAPASNIGGNIFEATVVFNNAMRVTGNNTQFFRAPNVAQPDKLWLDLTSDNGVFNQILVAYVDGATNAYDGMYYDAPRNQATGTYASLYSIIDNSDKPFAIQGKDPNTLNINETIALGFNNSIDQPTIFTISIAQLQGEFMTNNTIYLKDNLLNLTHDLTQSDYNFTAEVGRFNQRFEIVFNRETLSVGDEYLTDNELAIIELSNGDVQFIISQQHQIKEVSIIDLAGRVVYQLKGNHHTETYNLSQLSKAAYIAKVTLANGQTLYKKAVKRF